MPVGFVPAMTRRGRPCAGGMVGFGSGKAARMSWGHPCAGGIWLGGGGKDGGDGGGVCAQLVRFWRRPRDRGRLFAPLDVLNITWKGARAGARRPPSPPNHRIAQKHKPECCSLTVIHKYLFASWCLRSTALLVFSRKHGEGFFRWVHLICSHESQYKVSLQGIIIMKVIAKNHCKESLQGVMRVTASCKEPSAWSQVQVASARS